MENQDENTIVTVAVADKDIIISTTKKGVKFVKISKKDFQIAEETVNEVVYRVLE